MSQRPLPATVVRNLDRNLHRLADHPICIVKELAYAYFADKIRPRVLEDLPKVVSVADNFDHLLIPADHPARSASDTFYMTPDTVLRTQTTAHQCDLLRSGLRNFLVVGDVFRRDEVDRTHHPVFHQLEGVAEVPAGLLPVPFLQDLLAGLVEALFPGCAFRFSDDSFPFTLPSFEMEVFSGGRWLEILGCGVVHPEILAAEGVQERCVAWGLGLDRLAMVLFQIPDIRLLWSEDPKFTGQFRRGRVNGFLPFSTVPPVRRDLSFWLPPEDVTADGRWERLNDFYEMIREADPLIESVELTDTYAGGVARGVSHTFSLTFSPVADLKDPAQLTAHANAAMERFRETVAADFGVRVR